MVLITYYLVVLISLMVTQTDIPSDLSDGDKAYIFQLFDAQLNSGILYALLYGGQ